MTLHSKIFDAKGNLTLEGRIIYAHAMHLSKVDDLPEELLDHVWENDDSRSAIAELYELLDIETVKKNPHTYFKKVSTDIGFLKIDWSNLDAAMQDILQQALAEQATPNRKMERKMAMSFKTSATKIEVLQPKKDAVCIQRINFVFSFKTPQPYWLHFKNAQGQSKGEFEIPKGSNQFQISIEDKIQFPTGLYYWTLLANGTPMTNRLYICTEEDTHKILTN